MIISLVILYKALLKANSSKPAPIYHKTWKDEVSGYPASSYAKSLEMVINY
jgi:hypothetical protein